MPGYFSFQKLITPRFVKFIYLLGLIALTAGGIGLATWAGLSLRSATMPTRMGVYYIAIGAGIAIIGNLCWRVLCEIWMVIFNIHNLLGSIARETIHELDERELPSAKLRDDFSQDVTHEPGVSVAGRPSGVLGLT